MKNKQSPLSPESIRSYENLPVPFCIYRLAGGRYTLILVSDGMCSLLGMQRDKILLKYEQEPEALIHPEDVAAVRDVRAYAMLHPDDEYRAICRLRKQTGAYFWASCSGRIQTDGNGEKLLFAQYADVTDRETLRINIETERKHRELLFKEILDTTQTALFWKDTDRRFLGVNKAFLDYYGFADESVLIGKNDEDVGWHTDPDPYKNDELQVLSTGKSTFRVPGRCISHGENRNIVASKSPLYIEGKIAGLVGSFEDVTTECRQQEKIIDLNKQLESEVKNARAASEAKSEIPFAHQP